MKNYILKSFLASLAVLGSLFLIGFFAKDAGDIIICGFTIIIDLMLICYLIFILIKKKWRKAFGYLIGICLTNIIIIGLFLLVDYKKTNNKEFKMEYEEIKKGN